MRFDIDHRWFPRCKRLIESARQVARLEDSDPERAHRFSDLGKVVVGEEPKLVGTGCLRTIDCLNATLFLVEGMVVVDHRDSVDPKSHSRFQLGYMIPDSAVSGEAENRPIGVGALGAHGRG